MRKVDDEEEEEEKIKREAKINANKYIFLDICLFVYILRCQSFCYF